MRDIFFKDRYSHWHSHLATDETYANYAESKKEARTKMAQHETDQLLSTTLTEALTKEIDKLLK